jgi:hypothetical protein
MARRIEDFQQHCDEIGALVEKVPRADDRAALYAKIEELVNAMSGDWMGFKVGWLHNATIPDTPEGLE